jgi:hypothetical protein
MKWRCGGEKAEGCKYRKDVESLIKYLLYNQSEGDRHHEDK